MTTIELSPVLVAANGLYKGPVTVINGGIPAIVSGDVDIATNAETQLLRASVDDPSLRVLMTVSESFYRIVGRRSAGIGKVRISKVSASRRRATLRPTGIWRRCCGRRS